MKKTTLALTSLTIVLCYILFSSYSGGVANSGGGDRTGSPISSGSCGNCHSGGSFGASISLTVKDTGNNTVTSYIGGQTYFLEYTVSSTSGSPQYGFQSVALTSTNANAGDMDSVLTSNTRISTFSSRDYAENDGKSTTGFFRVRWIAPAANTGNVSIYYIGNAINNNSGTSGDQSTASQSMTLSEQLVFSGSASVINHVSCNGQSDGKAVVNVANGSPNYSYNWSNGATTSGTNSTSDTVSNLSAGVYTVTVTDGTNAIDTATVMITEPAILSVQTTAQNVSCHGGSNGSILSTVTGGTAPYTYLWSNTSTLASPTNLTAGTYSVTVTDANNCTQTSSATITQPSALTISATVQNLVCSTLHNGAISVSAMGGIPGYTYSWSNGGTSSSIQNLSSGTYTVTLTDMNGCTKDSSFTINSQFSTIQVDLQNSYTGCDSVSISPSGQFTSYLWSNGSNQSQITVYQTGKINLNVIDSNGCSSGDSTTVTINKTPVFSLGNDTTLCDTSYNNFVLSGIDSAGYTYLWSTNETTSSIKPHSPGIHWLEITNNGCTYRDSILLGIKNCSNGIFEAGSQTGFTIYPNPVKDELFIESSNEMDQIFILSIDGRLIHSEKISGQKKIIQLSDFNKGIYHLRIKQKEKIFSHKFVIL